MGIESMAWVKHLMGCQRKGREAALRGDSRESCPYKVQNPWGATGPKNMTRLRTQYWLYGYDTVAGADAKDPET